METFKRALRLAAIAVLVAAAPLLAGSYSVILVNGTIIESRYPPRPVPGDPDKLQLVTEWGNWISLDRAHVQAIRATGATTGDDRSLDSRPRFVGPAPNDAPRADLEEQAKAGPLDPEALLDYLMLQLGQRLERVRANTVVQFTEPPVAGRDRGTGLPLWGGTGTTMDPELLRLQGLTPELMLKLQGLTPELALQLQGLPTAAAVPTEGAAAPPPSESSPPGDGG